MVLPPCFCSSPPLSPTISAHSRLQKYNPTSRGLGLKLFSLVNHDSGLVYSQTHRKQHQKQGAQLGQKILWYSKKILLSYFAGNCMQN